MDKLVSSLARSRHPANPQSEKSALPLSLAKLNAVRAAFKAGVPLTLEDIMKLSKTTRNNRAAESASPEWHSGNLGTSAFGT
jgi:hypothetical protein